MDSDYCYSTEMRRALERHERGEAHVIPIILRPVDFEMTPFRQLQALPTDAKPVMSSSWQYQDEAFVNVTKGIRKVVEEITTKPSPLSNNLGSINSLIEKGGAVRFNAGIVSGELPEFVHDLPKVEPTNPKLIFEGERKQIHLWTERRQEIIDRNREVFLAHIIAPSKIQEQQGQKKWFDVYIFLARHHKVANAEIDYAEFFLGKSWGDRIYHVEYKGGDIKTIGISTSAYGTTLAICRVVFKDGYEAVIDRYIDFEMGKQVFQSVSAKEASLSANSSD